MCTLVFLPHASPDTSPYKAASPGHKLCHSHTIGVHCCYSVLHVFPPLSLSLSLGHTPGSWYIAGVHCPIPSSYSWLPHHHHHQRQRSADCTALINLHLTRWAWFMWLGLCWKPLNSSQLQRKSQSFTSRNRGTVSPNKRNNEMQEGFIYTHTQGTTPMSKCSTFWKVTCGWQNSDPNYLVNSSSSK